MNKKFNFLLLTLLLFIPLIKAQSVTFYPEHLDNNTVKITLNIALEPNEWLYKDSLTLTVDNPTVQLSAPKYSKDSLSRYDHAFKKTKKIFENDLSITIEAIKTSDHPGDTYLHVASATNTHGPQEVLFALPFDAITPTTQQVHKNSSVQKKVTQQSHQNNEEKKYFSLSEYVSNLVKTVQSPFIRFLLVFLLGVLLSLTPCIYPMVPITIGVLQAQGSKSLIYNFLLALAYTCGIATTFAFFGLLVSCTGPLCGQLLMEPLFIGGLVIILGYLGLSMLGFYDVYVPKFFKPSTKSVKGGSLLSSFIFGAASGTIASPCVSPGLVLLLSIVATLNNKLLGFLLLFVFGVGLSTPLLIVGSFSSSLTLLPRAGLWMVEIKKLFGFVIFGMCFYYLSYILPLTILLWFIAAFVALVGLYYLYISQRSFSVWKKIHIWLGVVLLATSLILFFQAYRAITYAHSDTYDEHKNLWHTHYEDALVQARTENKKLFIDFWATFCPICLAINKNILTKPAISESLQHFVMLKVDGTYNANKPYDLLREKFSIQGFPTFLLIDPVTETIIQEWHGELYDMPEKQFIAQLERYF